MLATKISILFLPLQHSGKVITVTTTISIAIPCAHWVAAVFAIVFDHVLLIENMLVIIKISCLIFFKPWVIDGVFDQTTPTHPGMLKCHSLFYTFLPMD
jgi:hypothetical protein